MAIWRKLLLPVSSKVGDKMKILTIKKKRKNKSSSIYLNIRELMSNQFHFVLLFYPQRKDIYWHPTFLVISMIIGTIISQKIPKPNGISTSAGTTNPSFLHKCLNSIADIQFGTLIVFSDCPISVDSVFLQR